MTTNKRRRERYFSAGRPQFPVRRQEPSARAGDGPLEFEAFEPQESPGMKTEKITFVLSICAAIALTLALPAIFEPPHVAAQFSSDQRMPAFGYITGKPAITITNASATSAFQATTGASAARVQWAFGTVSGTYSGCTVQAKTSLDGTNWLALGSAVAITVTTGAVNAWDIYQQAPATSGVTVTTPSGSAAAGFGAYTEYVFACTSYGTSAPISTSVIYR